MALGPILTEVFRRYGLASLTDWASTALIQGWSEDQVMLELYNRPEFQTRFSGMFMRESKNLPPVSVDEYLDYERTVSSLASTWGMSLSKQEIDNLIGNDVSAVEAEQRLNIAATMVYDSDTETRSELERMFGVNTSSLMRYWMDPKAELGTLQQQYRMGEIAGAALRTNYGQISAMQAQRLSEVGLNRDSAQQGFAQLASSRELFSPINMGETVIDTEAQIDFLAGDTDAALALESRAAGRRAQFEGGGGYAVGEEGFATGKAK